MASMQHFHLVPLFNLSLTFTWHRSHTNIYATFLITWEAFWQSLGLQLLLVPSREPIRRKVTILIFYLTLTLLVTF